MGTALRWLAGLASLAGLVRLLRKRGGAPVGEIGPGPVPDDPAEKLRRKLAEAREQPLAEAHGQEPETVDVPPETDRSLEERRDEVHARAREAIDAMRGQE
jgi:hypothetical protein